MTQTTNRPPLPEQIEAWEEPNPSYGGWPKFLREHTELRDQEDGVLYFGMGNCNYLVFPSGLLVPSYGNNGKSLMDDIRRDGAARVETSIRLAFDTMQETIAALRLPDVKLDPESPIGEFDYGPFSGHAVRREAVSTKWNTVRGDFDPPKPAHWSVTVMGVEGAWREVRVPLKKNRTIRKAIIVACKQFKCPDVIMPSSTGWYGSVIELTE